MNSNEKQFAKSVVLNVAALVAGIAFNKYVGNKLEQKQDPGLFHRVMRWNFRVANKPAYIAMNVVAVASKLALEAYATGGNS